MQKPPKVDLERFLSMSQVDTRVKLGNCLDSQTWEWMVIAFRLHEVLEPSLILNQSTRKRIPIID